MKKLAGAFALFIALGLAGAWSARVCWYIIFGILSIVLFVTALVLMLLDSKFRDECWYERRCIQDSKNKMFILKWLRHIFTWFKLIEPSKWISNTAEQRNRICGKDYTPYRNIEIYVLVWFTVEGLTLLGLVIRHSVLKYPIIASETNALIIVIPYLCFRLFSIFESWVNQFILQEDWTAIDINRSLVLAFIGYFEIVIIGTIIRFTNQQTIYIWRAFNDSVMAMIVNPVGKPSPILYTQIMFSILFVVVVAQHIIGRKTNS